MNGLRARRWGGWALGGCLGLWLSGCGFFQIKGSPTEGPNVPLEEKRLLQVPFFPDQTDQCGPSALASVLAFWGSPEDPLTLKKEIYGAHLRGSLLLDILIAAQNRGFKADMYNGSIDELKAELKRGRPLIVFINRGFDRFPIGHFLVVSGYDDERRGIYVHSGKAQNKFMRYRTFLRDWDKTQRSTLVISPAEQQAKMNP